MLYKFNIHHTLCFSVDDVAAAGFIYYPELSACTKHAKDKDCSISQLVKIVSFKDVSKISPYTICPNPKCHHVLDWSTISKKYDLRRRGIMTIPDVRHCI